MNPVELTREDDGITESMLKAALQYWYATMGDKNIAIRMRLALDAALRACPDRWNALRYLKLRDGNRIVCTLDGVHLSGAALDQECDK